MPDPCDSHDSHDEKLPSPGYLWRPSAPTKDGPLLIVVAVVIAGVVIGAVLLALLTSG